MNKYRLLIVALAIILAPGIVYAHEAETTKTVDGAITDILIEQDADGIDQLDCNRIADSRFEELGDAVMERMVGDH